jgi:hypothetical protein
MRLVGVALGIAIAACFDKPPRPEGDGGPGGECTSTTPFEDFNGSGSGIGSNGACPDGGFASSYDDYMIDQNGELVTGSVAGAAGANDCAYSSFVLGAGAGVTVNQALSMRSLDETYLELDDGGSSGRCSIAIVAQVGLEVDDSGTSHDLPVQVTAAQLRLRPTSATQIEGAYSLDGTMWNPVGTCSFNVMPPTWTLHVGIGYAANAGPTDTAKIDQIWHCK